MSRLCPLGFFALQSAPRAELAASTHMRGIHVTSADFSLQPARHPLTKISITTQVTWEAFAASPIFRDCTKASH